MLKMAEGLFFTTPQGTKRGGRTSKVLFLVAFLFHSWMIFQDMPTFQFLWHLCNCSLESVETVQQYRGIDVRTGLFVSTLNEFIRLSSKKGFQPLKWNVLKWQRNFNFVVTC